MLTKRLSDHCQACKFSPFDTNLIAVATSKTFGILGPGEIVILKYLPNVKNFQIEEITSFQARDTVLDCCWSESIDNVIIGALGDGTIPIFKITSNTEHHNHRKSTQLPIHQINAHRQEVSSVDWNIFNNNLILSTSWDMSIKLWDIEHLICVATLESAHSAPICAANFSPLNSNLIASVGSDLKLNIFDLRILKSQPSTYNDNSFATSKSIEMQNKTLSVNSLLSIKAHDSKILSLDWNKYQPYLLVTGATDGTMGLWDLRKINSIDNNNHPLGFLHAHKLAVRKVKFDPFTQHTLASCSYDMTVKTWEMKSFPPTGHNIATQHFQPLLNKCYDHHTEFILGLDWNLLYKGLICSASWDRQVCIWKT